VLSVDWCRPNSTSSAEYNGTGLSCRPNPIRSGWRLLNRRSPTACRLRRSMKQGFTVVSLSQRAINIPVTLHGATTQPGIMPALRAMYFRYVTRQVRDRNSICLAQPLHTEQSTGRHETLSKFRWFRGDVRLNKVSQSLISRIGQSEIGFVEGL
jgi:hypothetical protein